MKDIIRLRKPNRADKKYFLKWWTDPKLIALTSGRPAESLDRLGGYFAALLAAEHNFMITVGGKTIGHVRLIRRGKNAFGFPIVIGDPKYRGRGYGSQAIKKALRIGFGKLGYGKAKLEVRPENTRAIRTYVSLGFRAAGMKYYKNLFQSEVLVMTLDKREFQLDK